MSQITDAAKAYTDAMRTVRLLHQRRINLYQAIAENDYQESLAADALKAAENNLMAAAEIEKTTV